MTDFFEHQRRARKKSQRVLVVFFLLMLFLLYVFNIAVYWIVGGMTENSYPTYSTTAYKYQTDVVPPSSLPEAKSILDLREQPVTRTASEFLQKIFFIHPHTAHMQWAIIGLFLLLFMGGFLFKIFQYYSYPRAVVQSMVYREVFYHSNVSEAERRLLNIVEEMCISAGIPVVKTYLLTNEHSINAFTAGYDLRTAHIVVTQGALDHLNRDEMQAVIAHEVGHITSADVSVNTLLLSCIFSMTIIMTTGIRILRSSSRSSSSSSSNRRGGGGAGQILLIAVLLVCIGALGAYCGRALQSMFSRKREFLADSLAVQFTRNPSALASALAKIRDQIFVKMNHFQAANISHMCFVSSAHQGLFGVFATHPPIEDRIAVLDKEYLGVHPETEKLFTKKETPKVEKKKNTIHIPFDHLGPQVTAQRVVADSSLLFDPYLSYREAERLLGSLRKQPEVEHALHTLEDFKYPVWGLFISHDEVIKTKQIAVLRKHYGQDFSEKKLNDSILPDEECVELVNSVVFIALARAQSLDKEAKGVFLASLQELMMADEVIEPFEHLIYCCFMANNLLEKEVSRIQLEHLRSLLFLCVKLNKTSEQHELQIYQQALEKYMGVKQESVTPPKSIELGDTTLLLRQLRTKSLQTRREVLLAVRSALFSDGKITLREYEAYRAISLALDIPAPLVANPF
ncbi:MAG: M48 family metalloprotease [Bdellovibrionaceae bacterium]|nr:M48 family metalloprotease [Pseudobdellovibrionaceae bacterium]